MSKRIKKVFGSISQVCHVWAQQTQEEGRAGNVYFENTTDIYSYGSHYLMARVHEVDGVKIAMVRSDSYSSSTSKHIRDTKRALIGVMPYYNVPDVETFNSVENYNYFNDQVINQIDSMLSTNKVTSDRDIQWKFKRLNEVLKDANKFFALIDKPSIEIPTVMLDVIEEYLKNRLKRYHELNTPEMIAKKETEKLKREAREPLKLQEKLKTDIKSWRDFTFTTLHSLRSLQYDILRVRNDTVETSSGANVPLSHALRLLGMIERGTAKSGERIGYFTLDSIINFDPMLNNTPDTIVKIGCHKIRLSEARQVLNPYKNDALRLVGLNYE